MRTPDEIKKHFKKTFAIEKNLNAIEEKITILRSKQLSPNTSLQGRLGVQQSTKTQTAPQDLSISILELEELKAKTKDSLTKLEREIKNKEKTIKDPVKSAILTWRYICRYDWHKIAKMTELTVVHVRREHEETLRLMHNS